MASLVLGTVGAVVGFATGGPVGAQIGWMIGSTAGQLFAPRVSLPATYGPRLGDRTVQSSTYGQMIPIPFGNSRFAGNMIWTGGINEVATTTTQSTGGGGKGGGGSSQSSTTYTYNSSFAIALCEGPIAGIRRIWADGKLVYDIGATATTSSIIASNASSLGMRFYLGDENQTPDSLIVSLNGANTPAYRGTAYALLDTFQLANFGNRIPNFTAEVSTVVTTDLVIQKKGAVWTPPAHGITDAQRSGSYGLATMGYSYAWNMGQFVNGGTELQMIRGIHVPPWPDPSGIFIFYRDRLFIDDSNRIMNEVIPWQPTFDSRAFTGMHVCASINSDENAFFGYTQPSGSVTGNWYVNFDRQIQYEIDLTLIAVSHAQQSNNVYFAVSDYAAPWGAFSIYWLDLSMGDAAFPTKLASQVPAPGGGNLTLLTACSANYWWLYMSSDAGGGWSMRKYPHGSGTPSQTWAGTNYAFGYPSGEPGRMHVIDEVLNSVISFNNAAGGSGIYLWVNGITTKQNPVTPTPAYSTFDSVPDIYGNGTFCFINSEAGGYFPYWMTVNTSFSSVALSTIVAALVNRSGLQASDYDVSLLTNSVRGFLISKQMSIRAALEALQSGFFFDVIESDGKIKFIPRGNAPVVTINQDEAAATDYSNIGSMPDIITVTRKQELEMSQQVLVNYYNVNADYQQGTQYSARLITSAVNQLTQDLPIVFTDEEAAKVADILLYNDWQSRELFELLLPKKYVYLDPADVIIFSDNTTGLSYTLRIISTEYSPEGVIKLALVIDGIQVYSTPVIGAVAGPVVQTIALAGPTRLEQMDLPILQDSDNDAGYYIAACGYLPSWVNGQLFKSLDGGATWAVNAPLVLGIIGNTTNILGSFSGGNVWDMFNTVNVKLVTSSMALSSISELQTLNGQNSFCIGNEVVQAQNCILQGDGSYTLSKLLRNRKNSNFTQNGAHTAGERFVVLNGGSAQRDSQNTADVGISRLYKPVTLGSTLGSVSAVSFTGNGSALKPFAPVNIGGIWDASNNCIIQWDRCNRLSGEWRDYVDVPMSEATESYSVDILNGFGGPVLRTLSSVAPYSNPPTNRPFVAYSAAQQVTDFGSVQSIFACNLYQISATVGRGFPGKAIVGSGPLSGAGTYDPAAKSSHITLSGGNLTAVSDNTGSYQNVAVTPYQGFFPRYCEVVFAIATGSARRIGLSTSADSIADGTLPGVGATSYAYDLVSANGKIHNSVSAAYGSPSANGVIIGMYWDPVSGNLGFTKNGVDMGIAFTGVFGSYRIVVGGYANGVNNTINVGGSPFSYSSPIPGSIGW